MVSTTDDVARSATERRYFTVWRWHFYCSLYVFPFLMMLAVTGLIMLWVSAMTELMTSSLMPTVQAWAVWVETAGREIVTWVGLSTETTNAPTGIPVPEMVMPGPMPTVELIVTAVELIVVAPEI